MEPLCYYFGMKPSEYWNITYKEANLFCMANSCKMTDDLRREINVQEAVSDKLIQSNPFLYEKPKIPRLIEIFKDLFKKEEKEQTIEEQMRILRGK